MALSFKFIAAKKVTRKQVESVLAELALGVLDSHEGIEVYPLAHGTKFTVHYIKHASTALSDRLKDFEVRREAGESVRPPRIIFSKDKHGAEKYWKIFPAQTLDERDKNAFLEGW